MTTTITGATGVNQITDDAITVAKLPTGSVLQVIEATHKLDGSNGNTATTSSSYVTIYSGTITPSSTSSKILVKLIASVSTSMSSVQWQAPNPSVNVFRGSTEMWNHSKGASFYQRENVYAAHHQDGMLSLEKLDSPSSTSAVQYDVKLKASDVTSMVMMGSSLILTEIAG